MNRSSEQKFGVAAREAALSAVSHRASQLAERQEKLIVGPREPLRRNPADALAAIGNGDGVASEGENSTLAYDEVSLAGGVSVVSWCKNKGGG